MASVAFDIDLRRVHGFSDRDGRVCYKAPDWPWDVLGTHDTILVEVASPQDTSKSKAEAYNRRRWMISNAAQFGRLVCWAEMWGMLDKILVSTAPEWTLGYAEEMREAIAGCRGEDNHDIRACRCMLHFFRSNPDKWYPVTAWYDKISTKPKPRRKPRRQ